MRSLFRVDIPSSITGTSIGSRGKRVRPATIVSHREALTRIVRWLAMVTPLMHAADLNEELLNAVRRARCRAVELPLECIINAEGIACAVLAKIFDVPFGAR